MLITFSIPPSFNLTPLPWSPPSILTHPVMRVYQSLAPVLCLFGLLCAAAAFDYPGQQPHAITVSPVVRGSSYDEPATTPRGRLRDRFLKRVPFTSAYRQRKAARLTEIHENFSVQAPTEESNAQVHANSVPLVPPPHAEQPVVLDLATSSSLPSPVSMLSPLAESIDGLEEPALELQSSSHAFNEKALMEDPVTKDPSRSEPSVPSSWAKPMSPGDTADVLAPTDTHRGALDVITVAEIKLLNRIRFDQEYLRSKTYKEAQMLRATLEGIKDDPRSPCRARATEAISLVDKYLIHMTYGQSGLERKLAQQSPSSEREGQHPTHKRPVSPSVDLGPTPDQLPFDNDDLVDLILASPNQIPHEWGVLEFHAAWMRLEFMVRFGKASDISRAIQAYRTIMAHD
ncbi:hypothetical protein IWQ60_006615 [Tieghemiomyces parasiticus]|uniref:Uncharacterized protein n=1 Tax=Tieghemiomyces parasiticus TaxID=78921 RepID=A0A9W8A7G5_9FUNG|nr:hypothetical protein IWQ60_006615 [Tieghemiomyces parasiticus]